MGIKENLKKMLSITINTIFYTTLIVFIYTTCTFVFNGFDRTKMNFLGYSLNHVVSASMEPTIMTGDFVITKQVDFEDIKVGDIIVYKYEFKDGEPVAIIHRVYDKQENYLLTKGDNNLLFDPYVIRPEDVRTRVVCHF